MKRKLIFLLVAAVALANASSVHVHAVQEKTIQTDKITQSAKIEIEKEEKVASLAGRTVVSGAAIGGTAANSSSHKTKTTSSQTTMSSTQAVKTETKQASYTKTELKLLACLVYAEAGNQSYQGKLAVANVVLNRVASKEFPNTIKEVIYQSGYSRAYGRTIYQFSVASPSVGTLKKALSVYGQRTNKLEIAAEEDCIKAAKAALEGKSALEKKYLFFSQYSSSLASRNPNGVKLGAHYFYK